MADAMNRSIGNIIVGGFGTGDTAVAALPGPAAGVRAIEADDAAIQLAYAAKVIIVPGYGLVGARRPSTPWPSWPTCWNRAGSRSSYAIHPVAGRMPGHMNVLPAEANVPYPQPKEMDDQPGVRATDVALVIGANDVTNLGGAPPGHGDFRDADPGRGPGEEHHRDQAVDGPGVRRDRQRALRQPEIPRCTSPTPRRRWPG
jgi:NAD(P) transhydrogenase subunit beta